MLKTKKACLFLLGISFSASTIAEGINVNWAASAETNFYSWEVKDSRLSGYQFVTPVNVSTTSSIPDLLTINAGIRTAHIASENRSNGAIGSVENISDTSLNLALSYDAYRIKPWVSLDINAPTGKSTLKGQEKNAIMDPNLVGQTRFGEGLNLSPAAGFVFELTKNDVVSIGASHNIKGKYTPDGDTNVVLDPGDIYTASLQYQRLTKDSYTSLGMVYNNESATKLADIEVFQPGERFDVNASHTQRFWQRHTLSGFLRYSTSDKNKRFDPFLGKFSAEERKGAGDVYFIGADYAYQYGQRLSGGVGFDYLLRQANQFQVGNDLFIPNRDKWSVNVFSNYMLTENSGLKRKVSYFEMRDQKTSFKSATDYSGVTASIGIFFQY